MPKREITHINLIGNSGGAKGRRSSGVRGVSHSKSSFGSVEGARKSRSKARRGR
tara:strand:- start:405 stop:566 length:162 start_codon:yes stop_codon:yes gene_type:complete